MRVLDFGQLLTLIVKRAVEFMEATEGVLWVLDSRTNRLCPVEWSGREPSEEERRGIRIVAGTRDVQSGAVDEIVRALEREEDLVVPLVCRREVVGALVLRGVARGKTARRSGIETAWCGSREAWRSRWRTRRSMRRRSGGARSARPSSRP